MPRSHRQIVMLAAALVLAAALGAGCTLPEAPAPLAAATSPATLPEATLPEEAATVMPAEVMPTVAPPEEAEPTATLTPEAEPPTAEPTAEPVAPQGDLGLSAGAAQLVAALGAATPCSALRFEPTTLADGSSALVGVSPDGSMIAEIVGPEESPVTASWAMLLPEGDPAALETARAGLYQLIGAAMPERAWAVAWLDERIDGALAGTPYSDTQGDYYVQVVRLSTPQPCITIAVTLAPQRVTLPTWAHLGAATATVDATWERLPVMPDPVRGQRLPTEGMEMYEYAVAAGPEAVEAFCETAMVAEGWELAERAVVGDPGAPGVQQIVLVYRRGAEGALVTIERYPALQETLVTLGYAAEAADLPAIAG